MIHQAIIPPSIGVKLATHLSTARRKAGPESIQLFPKQLANNRYIMFSDDLVRQIELTCYICKCL